MKSKCKICQHADRGAIEKAALEGKKYRDIAALYGVSPMSITRHRRHLGALLIQNPTLEADGAKLSLRTVADDIAYVRQRLLWLDQQMRVSSNVHVGATLTVLKELRETGDSYVRLEERIEAMKQTALAAERDAAGRSKLLENLPAVRGILTRWIGAATPPTLQERNLLYECGLFWKITEPEYRATVAGCDARSRGAADALVEKLLRDPNDEPPNHEPTGRVQ